MNDWIALFTHNDLEHLAVAAGVFALTLGVLVSARASALGRLQRCAPATAHAWDDTLLEMVRATRHFALLAMSLMLGLRMLEVPDRMDRLLDKGMLLVFILQAGLWVQAALLAWLTGRQRSGPESRSAEIQTHLSLMRWGLQLALWTVVVLMVLDNLGFNITTLVASLGIGGVAVALAVQSILGDLFASLSISLDKPFLVGDFIVVDDLSGTVKHVGLKTTRIQSITGEELVVANNDLLKSRIRNYKRMQERRIVFRFGLTYDTPTDTLRQVPERVKAIIDGLDGTRFDRAHFATLGESSLDFEVVYFMTMADYGPYMDTQQQINLALMDMVRELGAGFAFPTRTLQLASPEGPGMAPPAAT